ncbi:phaC PHA synthase [Vibrio sp. SS-MA-C1-2]|uniref:VC2662 family protein n=1 Tax=Vibrio sp. SS-MA-C1-2 TaxID=2908646 RepID=UPI001F285EAB|nr:phaC PHA synthase [Vibrio sp. SS-MA-C1-2]UJF18875.1 phaC PHA synthase [Vibrio sp. SS-MA-C1-2]
MNKLKHTLAATLLLASPLAVAETAPAMFSTINYNTPDAQEVEGVRLAVLRGTVSDLKGIDVSILGMSETDNTVGLNFGLLFGSSKINNSMTGVSLGTFNWNTGQTNGVNLGLFNMTNNVTGINIAAMNYSKGHTLVDFGFGNVSENSAVQLGFFNVTKEIDGVQLGLFNCADNGFVKCFRLSTSQLNSGNRLIYI